MKKFIGILTVMLFVFISVNAQIPFVRDGNYSYLKYTTDKVGIGTATPGEKLTIVSQAGEPILGLKGYSNQYSPYMYLMNSYGTKIFQLWAKTDWWTIGSSIDSTTATISVKPRWTRINTPSYFVGNLHVVGAITATGSITPSVDVGAGLYTTLGASGLFTSSSTAGIKFSSTAMTKGIDFTGTQLAASQENAAFAYGTWTAPIYVIGHTAHYAPIQVNLHVSSSAAKDVTGMRIRVDSDADTACTLTAMQGLEMRASMGGAAIGSHTLVGSSTSVDAATTCTGDFLNGYFNIQGAQDVTCSNHVNVLEATKTGAGLGVKNVFHATMNGTGSTITNIIKAENIIGTATSLINGTRTAGTVTNGLYLTGTMTHDVRLQNGEFIDNTCDGSITVPNVIRLHTPVAVNSTATVNAATMLAGVITSTSAQATGITTPTATAIAALIPGCAQGTAFDLIIDNSAGQSTVTLVLDNSITVVNPAIITGGATLTLATLTTGKFSFYFTSGTTAKCYRVY